MGCGGGDNYMSNVFGIGFLFPPADFVLFCIWYLIFICLVSKRYLFSIFLVSIWYLIDTIPNGLEILSCTLGFSMTNLNCIYNNVSVLNDGGTFDASPKTTS